MTFEVSLQMLETFFQFKAELLELTYRMTVRLMHFTTYKLCSLDNKTGSIQAPKLPQHVF